MERNLVDFVGREPAHESLEDARERAADERAAVVLVEKRREALVPDSRRLGEQALGESRRGVVRAPRQVRYADGLRAELEAVRIVLSRRRAHDEHVAYSQPPEALEARRRGYLAVERPGDGGG